MRPIYTQGTQDDFNGVIGTGVSLPPGKYLISVLADGYKIGGEHFTSCRPAAPWQSPSSCSPIRCRRPRCGSTSLRTSRPPTAPLTPRPSRACPASRPGSTTSWVRSASMSLATHCARCTTPTGNVLPTPPARPGWCLYSRRRLGYSDATATSASSDPQPRPQPLRRRGARPGRHQLDPDHHAGRLA